MPTLGLCCLVPSAIARWTTHTRAAKHDWTARYIPHGHTCEILNALQKNIDYTKVHDVANTCKSTKQCNAVRGDARWIHLSVNVRLMMNECLNYRSMPSLQKQHRSSERELRAPARAREGWQSAQQFKPHCQLENIKLHTKLLHGRVCAVTTLRKDGAATLYRVDCNRGFIDSAARQIQIDIKRTAAR